MTEPFSVEPIAPFGVVVTAAPDPGVAPSSVDAAVLVRLALEHRVVVLRGFERPSGDALPAFARRFGELQLWDFGAVNELVVHDAPKNYLFTTGEVPFHWDGAFAGVVPALLVFCCEDAPEEGGGGETVFADATRILAAAPADRRALWSRAIVTYETEKVAHYGGRFTAPILGRHPGTGEETLRFAEPVDGLNPVSLTVEGIDDAERNDLIGDLGRRLRDRAFCYAHRWRRGDVVLADNHALLHGRRAFTDASRRHLRRVNVISCDAS